MANQTFHSFPHLPTNALNLAKLSTRSFRIDFICLADMHDFRFVRLPARVKPFKSFCMRHMTDGESYTQAFIEWKYRGNHWLPTFRLKPRDDDGETRRAHGVLMRIAG